MIFRGLIIVFCMLVISSCIREPIVLTVSHSPDQHAPLIAQKLSSILEHEEIQLSFQTADDPISLIESVRVGEVDLGIVNEPPFRIPGIRTVVPLYPSIIHVMYRNDREVESFPDLIRGQQIYAGPAGGPSWRVLRQLAREFSVSEEEYSVLSEPGLEEPDVYIIMGGLLSPEGIGQLSGYQLYSFGEASELGFGTVAEGLALKYPNVRPFILPESVYGSFNDEPVLTLATRTVLVASREMNPNIVYLIASRLFEEAHLLSVEYPLVLKELDDDIDPDTLAMPLHEGSGYYIDKDKPGFFERYAESIGVILTALVLVGSGILTLLRMRRHRQKDRIDVYYHRVLEIRHRLEDEHSPEELSGLEKSLKSIQEEVFGLLIAERLNVDESLTVFLDLSNRVLGEINTRQSPVS